MQPLGLLVFAVLSVNAAETPQWPPPEPVAARMRELQQAIIARDSTHAQRDAAREELAGLLKSPAGQQRGRSADEKSPRPARAAIDPYPGVVVPLRVTPSAPVPAAEVARIEVVVPPTNRFAIDPRTGNVLHETGPGFVDPRTGQLVPR